MSADEFAVFMNGVLIPSGLMLIMFSLGLSLSLRDFKNIIQAPKAVMIGFTAQMLLIPLLAFTLVTLFQLPPGLALGMMILSVCPGGVTSNAMIFAARGDVALSISLTTLSSFLTIITTPLMMGLFVHLFYDQGTAPPMSVVETMKKLMILSLIPITLGMTARALLPKFAELCVPWLRPMSMIVLISIILFSIFMERERLFDAALLVGPPIILLNITAMALGTYLATKAKLPSEQVMTIGIEVGVQNASMASFLVLFATNDIALAIAPNVYGVLMFITAGIYIRTMRRRARRVTA